MQLMDQGEARPYALGSTELDGYGAFAAVMEDEGITVHAASSGAEARELMGQLPDAGVVTMLPPNLGRGPEGS
ncbi:hypothetical protein [Nesterenkonia pannonica]|uniref:hypothetical protein n=1 Tax=Nesterenkonia pannonica TaxID=1548602 RepID=UPI002164AF02|nr:hypothetical protein [Nesterenkonia pannonica]